MSSVNLYTREISLKIVYYGPGLGGKTSSLQYIHRAIKPDARGQLVSLSTGVDRTLYFDFLPVKLPKLRGYTVRVQLYTVPGQVHYNATRKLVLTAADGLVFVADAQGPRRGRRGRRPARPPRRRRWSTSRSRRAARGRSTCRRASCATSRRTRAKSRPPIRRDRRSRRRSRRWRSASRRRRRRRCRRSR